jgi:CMP/dCMP kinase
MTVIAIDGPAGAGKSTIARGVAERLGWLYVDTGAMYRAVALGVLERDIDPNDASAVAGVARSADIRLDDDSVLLDGRDVTSAIREDPVTRTVSKVSAHPDVRAALVPLQRASADSQNVVMEGRDIGNAVFPDARVKVWLTASPAERAVRRLRQLGRGVDVQEVAEMERQIVERDERDASRVASPMRRPSDSIEIDTTDKSIETVIEEIVRLVRARSSGD